MPGRPNRAVAITLGLIAGGAAVAVGVPLSTGLTMSSSPVAAAATGSSSPGSSGGASAQSPAATANAAPPASIPSPAVAGATIPSATMVAPSAAPSTSQLPATEAGPTGLPTTGAAAGELVTTGGPTPAATTAALAATVVKPVLPVRAGSVGADVTAVQQRLSWLGYRIKDTELATATFGRTTQQAVKSFQGKWSQRATGVVSKPTWAELKRKSGTVGSLPAACTSVRAALCVDKDQKVLRWVRDGVVALTVDTRFGPEYSAALRTREGIFTVYRKSRDHVSSKYHTSMPFAMFFSGGQAVHYSPYFARDGYAGNSHGCVNVRDYQAIKKLFDRVAIGTRVVIYQS
ncbi:MAG: murein L,D-transpeptidase [Actinomycetota bacterium]|nr:MAG: murein L,D-transpeptidase [Actinomycetota bacterium]